MGGAQSTKASNAATDEARQATKVVSTEEASGKLLCPQLSRTVSEASTGSDDASSDADCSSDDCSDGDHSAGCAAQSKQYQELGELPATYTAVKNTFIQIALPSEVHVRQRSSSCPAGLSRRSRTDVQENSHTDSSSKVSDSRRPECTALHLEPCKLGFTSWSTAEVVPPPQSPPRKLPAIVAGAEVEIVGLSRAPHFNGRVGVVESFDSDMDRYVVVLDASQSCPVKVKGANLRLHAVAPPPCFEPTLEINTLCLDECVSDSTPSTPRWEDEAEVLGFGAGLRGISSFCLNTQAIPSIELQYNDGALPGVSSILSFGDGISVPMAYADWQYDCCDYGIPKWEDYAIPR